MNPNNDGMGLHAFTGRHLFKLRQYLGAYIYLQAYVVHFVYILSKTRYNIYRQAAYVIHQPTSCPVQAFLNLFKAGIHTYKRMAYYIIRL